MQTFKSKALSCAVSTACSSFFLFSPFGQAQETAALDEIVVISSRIATPLRQIGTSVAVINEEEIRARGSLSLIDILRSMPSVAVSNSGGAGKTTTLRIRGEEGFRTIALLDGLKLSDPSITQVQPQLEHTLSTGVERVEILRGPQGFNYGADAGGIINIGTRATGTDAKELRSQIDAQTGSFGTQQLAANVSGGNDRADFFVAGARYTTDGFNILAADNVLADKDGYENTSFHSRVGFNASDTWRFDLVHRDVAGATEFDNCFDPVTFASVHDCDGDYDQRATRLSAKYDNAGLMHSLAWSNTATDRENFTFGSSTFVSNGELERVEYLGNFSRFAGANFVYGIDNEKENNNGDTRSQLGYYFEYLSDFSEQFFVTAGVRHDDNDDFGDHTSYRLTTAYLVPLQNGDTLKLRANYGTGFRAPSLYETSYNSGPWASPPASSTVLTEELSKGHEAAIEYFGQQGLQLSLVYFDQRIEDAIYFDLSTFSGYLQDIGTSTSQGFEISAAAPLTDKLSLSANYTRNETEQPNGQQRQRRPKDLANLGLNYRALDERLKLNLFYRTSRRAIDIVGNNVFDLDNYDVIDFSASFRLSENIELYARLENAADERYEEVVGYNNGKRASYIGARVNF